MLLTLCFSMGAMTSCSDDDDEPDPGLTYDRIYGIWELDEEPGVYYQFLNTMDGSTHEGYKISPTITGSRTEPIEWIIISDKLRVIESDGYLDYDVVFSDNRMTWRYEETMEIGNGLTTTITVAYHLTKVNDL